MASTDDHEASAPRIHLYAEHLRHIRTLSIQASLATFSNHETKAHLSAAGDIMTLSHEGETATVQLPMAFPGGDNVATLTIPAAPTKDLQFRLNVEEGAGHSSSDLLGSSGDANGTEAVVVPWMATALTAETEVCCAKCQAVLVQRGRIQQWKDLPSEGWAEMMEFWHCHKPDLPHDHDHAGAENAGRGFAANSRLAVQEGVGLVGPMEFLFAQGDCAGVELTPSNPSNTSSPPTTTPPTLHCRACHNPLGVFDSTTEANRLRKPALSLSTSSSSPPVSHAPELWLSTHLLTAGEAQGTKRLVIYSYPASPTPTASASSAPSVLHTWLFAPDLTISSSVAEVHGPRRYVKVMWKAGVAGNVEEVGKVGSAQGELELGGEEFAELERMLEGSAGFLPEKAREFQGWRVGLLRRFGGGGGG